MQLLIAVLAILVAIIILFELAQRVNVPYPTLFVLGGLVLALVPGLPSISLEPDLVLLVFLPPLLFIAAVDTPIRELRRNLAPIVRLAFGLVLVTLFAVALVTKLVAPQLTWAVVFTLGAIVAPTDALAATSVFRRLGAPRLVVTLVEGEALFNDATALVAYRVAVAAAVTGAFVLADAAASFVLAVAGGIVIGVLVGWLATEILRRLDNPPVEVALSLVVPFVAYLPADVVGASGVLAAVAAGLVIGSRLGRILTASSRLLWESTWKMLGFVLNGFVFVLIGLELPQIINGLGAHSVGDVAGVAAVVCVAVVAIRFAWVFGASHLRSSPRQAVAQRDPRLARRLTAIVSWSGMRGAVSLAAALALPVGFPDRSLILLVTLAVILVTLVGQGLTLPYVVRRSGWDGLEIDGDEGTLARSAAYQAGLAELDRQRPLWPTHQPLFDRLESGLRDRTRHLATEDPEETADRRQERTEHAAIQLGVIAAQRGAVIDLRDQGVINDQTLRDIERELDLEEVRMEA